jgi:hypothetical protein
MTTIATTATAAAGLVDTVVTISRHLERARRRQGPRHIRCLSQEYRMSPVRRPSHRRHLADLGTAAASTEEVTWVEVDSGAAAASAEEAASVEVDSAALAAALAIAKRSFVPPICENRLGRNQSIVMWRTYQGIKGNEKEDR